MSLNNISSKTKLYSIFSISLSILLIIATFTVYYFNQQNALSARYYELKTLSQEITYFDEVLTMTTLVGVYSGKSQWSKRYIKNALLLDNSLKRAAQLDPKISQFINETEDANNHLVIFEKKAFSLINNRRQQEAVDLLTSNEYQKYKIQFNKGINEAVDTVLGETLTALDAKNRERNISMMIGMLVAFVLVLGLWLYLMLFLQKTDKIKNSLMGELQSTNYNLQKALEEVNSLRGIIPICSYCHEIRDDEGAWEQMEAYITKHSDATFSHGICPKCIVNARSEAGLDK